MIAERAWQAAQPWFASILEHPFVTGLTDGSLSRDAFSRYLVDDALADPDALLARFAERGEEGSAFDLMYANQDYGCVICHAP